MTKKEEAKAINILFEVYKSGIEGMEKDLTASLNELLKAIDYTPCCTELCDKRNKENNLQKLTDQAQDLGLGYD